MKRERQRKFGRVTRDGRIVVNVDELYRSIHVQRTMKELDDKVGGKKGAAPESTTSAYIHSLSR